MINNLEKINSVLAKNKAVVTVFFFVLFCTAYIFLKTFVYKPSFNDVSYTNNNFYVLSLSLPKNLNFCGEKIPSNDIEIKNDLDREFFNNSYWKSNSLILFNKAQRWFPYIEPILKEEGVPDDFKYLAVIESHLSNVKSPAGAVGFWQLVPSTAYNYGLEVSDNIDERYNVEKSTRAACAHIKDAHVLFKNWTLAAAAYNLGIGGIQRALRVQKTNNYHDLLLNTETGSFVYRILAYKTLFSNPSHFGIKKRKWNYFQKIPVKVYRIDSTVTNLESLAKKIKYSVATIRQFNPWLLKNFINNQAKKTYEIVVPRNIKIDYSAFLSDMNHNDDEIHAHTTEDNLQVVKRDTLPVISKTINYIVKVDEPLKNLADFFKVNEGDIRKWNNLGANERAIKGQTLIINFYSAGKKLAE